MQGQPAAPWPPPGTARHTLGLPADHPGFAGHFPGDPMFPGVAQLWIAHTLAIARYGPAFLRGFRRVKFRAPVLPDRRLDCDLAPTGPPGEVRFELRDHGHVDTLVTAQQPPGQTAAEGTIVLSREPLPEPARAVPPPAGSRPRPEPIESMLPHRGPALLVHEPLSVAQEHGAASWFRGRVPEDSFLVREGRASAIAAIEFAGQAAAALHEYRKPAAEPVRMLAGLLVGVKEAAFAAPDFPVQAELLAGVHSISKGGFWSVRADVRTVTLGELRELLAVELQILVR